MSVDKSLKTKGKLIRPRNVFTRVERIKILKEEGKWNSSLSVFGIPKVKTIKVKRKAKSEKKAAKAAEEAAVTTPAAGGATTPASAAAPAASKEKAKK